MPGPLPVRMQRAQLFLAWPGGVAVGAALVGRPMVWAGATVLACALARRPAWRSVPASLPIAAVLLVGYLTTALTVASWSGVPLLHSRAACAALMCSASVLATGLALGAHARSPLERGRRPQVREWVWLAPAALMAALGLVPLVLGPGSTSGWFFAGDHLRMLLLTVSEWRQGSLSYASTTYPKAWSTLMAMLWSDGGAADGSRGFLSLSRVMAASCWFAFALVTLGVSRLAVLVARALVLRGAMAGLAGALAGLATMTPWFAGSYLAKGFENSVLAVLCLVAVATELMEGRGARWSVVCAGAVSAVVAHTWQLFLPACGVAFLVAVQGVWKQRGRRSALTWAAIAGAPALVVALPGALAAVAQPAGLGHGAAGGDVPALAWEPLAAVVVCVVLLVWRVKAGAGGVGGYVAVVAVTLLSAPLLAVAVGVSLASYYPNKVIWGAVVLGLPVVAAVWLWGIETADSRRHRFVLIALGAGAGLCCVVGIVSPLTAPFGAWSTVDGGSVVRIMSAPGANRTQVFWSGRPGALDPTVQILLAMYRKGPLSPFEKLPTGSIAEQCARLRGTTEPGVLTTATADEARARFACVPAAAVITAPTR